MKEEEEKEERRREEERDEEEEEERNVSPSSVGVCDLEGGGASDQLVQSRHHGAELGPIGSFLLPAVQHERVQGHGAFWRGGQPEVLLYSVDHLERDRQADRHSSPVL